MGEAVDSMIGAGALDMGTPKIDRIGSHRDIVVVGASAGGVQVLTTLAEQLPADFAAAVFVVLHVMSSGRSMLARILDRSGPLTATTGLDGEQIASSHIYVAPPDRHMLLEDGVLRLTKGPRENRYRPAIDSLFRSAAGAYGPRVIGVVLSGLLHDGAEGLRAIKRNGGATVVQDPLDAQFEAMPRSAIAATEIDELLPPQKIPEALMSLVAEPLSRAEDLRREEG